MEVYLYCSYEHSQKGFCMTRLEGNDLIPAAFHELPKIAEEFFSIDRFLVLWRDLTVEDADWLKPDIIGSFFGLRGLHGTMSDGRSGTVNLAFYADVEELPLLRKTALTILGDYDSFQQKMFAWLKAGGACSYQLNCGAFQDWLLHCGQMNKLRRLSGETEPAIRLLPKLQRQHPPVVETELLRLAVCTSDWKEIRNTMGHNPLWYIKPRSVLTQDAFFEAFTGRGALWELTAAL